MIKFIAVLIVLMISQGCAAWYKAYGFKSEEELKTLSAIPRLLDACENPHVAKDYLVWQILGETEKYLANLGPEALPELARALEHKKFDVFDCALRAMTIIIIKDTPRSSKLLEPIMDKVVTAIWKQRYSKAGRDRLKYTPIFSKLNLVVPIMDKVDTAIWELKYGGGVQYSLKIIGEYLPTAAALISQLEAGAQVEVQANARDPAGPSDKAPVKARAPLRSSAVQTVPIEEEAPLNLVKQPKRPMEQPKNRPIVAVFGVENRAGLRRGEIEELTRYIATKMVESGRYKIVPEAELKKILRKEKAASYEACFDEACQIEIGKELAAEKSLSTRIARLGDICIVSLQLYDLREAAAGRAASARGGCALQAVFASIDTVLEAI
ncbi:MAG: hypothetical protein A3D65_03895 [Candidatus Lloydbacteria bacterium RIFCSPHIGHO2_02_FULL_50_13]|uniref:Uncharacterized protein n=1 Tax=Candidatus Lloydbacteria bacterium RIFCSPHIGHO2_02_FULL_50_13 TaxID=1798661 RepID=A0A1G2D1P1_9BACT|nr:MAG: hypothetical protein A3D65_03895 [Candidatus Lloydbacteria bacterium RIFCSPHIGHO2_02_FULL_50_13]